MKANKFFFLALSSFSISLFALAGCGEKGKLLNSPPADLTLSKDKCYVETGGTVRFQGHAEDDDGDSLTYYWKATAGSFDPPAATGETVDWIAPGEAGSVIITMTATDEIEQRSKTQAVTVCMLLAGPITTETTIENNGHVYMIKDVDPIGIPAGVTLTINPGVTIVIDGEVGGFDALGRIMAEGTSSQHIRFIANTCKGGTGLWGGIYMEGDAGEAKFKHVEVRGGADGIQASLGATLTLDSCEVYDTANVGVSVLDMSVASIHACKIWDNGTGISVENSMADIRESSIRYSVGNGIELSATQDAIQAAIDKCEIANHGFDGINLAGRANPTIHNCSIFSNGESGGYAIRLVPGYAATDSIHAENNFWGRENDTAEEIGTLIFDRVDSPGAGPGAIGAYVSFWPPLPSSPIQQRSVDKREARGRPWGK